MTTSRSSLPWLLLAPAGLLIIAIIYVPLVYSALISLTDAHLLRFSSAEFIGFGNYERLLARARLTTSLWRTFTYSAGVVVLSFLTGLFVALLMNRTTMLRGLTRTLLIIPWATPWLVVTLIWYVMFNPQIGPINEVLNLLGVLDVGHSWLYSSETAMLSIVIATSWRLFPAVTLILLAGLQGIPPEQYEAAEVDGASAWARFRYITMPGIRTVSITMLTLLTIWSSKLFTMAWTLTQGGPGDATRVLSVYTYQEAFGSNRLGRGSALAVISLLFSLLLVFVYLIVLRRDEEKAEA
ncbi:MAG: sugar ABC transporter permease [Anaerolineaceae bacterium]|nr:sugar ABC transporter permease [Anaerolineaceae bacterium]MCY4023566.1 sugar ABC transporter permease [Anaerolineaceae bacterium]